MRARREVPETSDLRPSFWTGEYINGDTHQRVLNNSSGKPLDDEVNLVDRLHDPPFQSSKIKNHQYQNLYYWLKIKTLIIL